MLKNYDSSNTINITDPDDYNSDYLEFFGSGDEVTTEVLLSNTTSLNIFTTKSVPRETSENKITTIKNDQLEFTSSGNGEAIDTEFEGVSNFYNNIEYVNKTDEMDNNNDYIEFTNTPLPETTKISDTTTNYIIVFTTTKQSSNENENDDTTESGSGNIVTISNDTTKNITDHTSGVIFTDTTYDIDLEYEILNAGSGSSDETQ